MSIQTLESIVRVRAIAVVYWDNGTSTTLGGQFVRAGMFDQRQLEGELKHAEVNPLIKEVLKVGVRPVKITWHRDVHTHVTYRTTGKHRKFSRSEHYNEPKE